MKSIAISAALLVLPAQSAEPLVHPDCNAPGWKPLFTQDLSNAIKPEGIWSVEEGILTASKDECIWTTETYGDAIIDLEFKTAEGTNSGVLVYGCDIKNWIPNSVEVQIADDFSKEWRAKPRTWQCAAIFGRLAAEKSAVRPPGEWNRMSIYCKGMLIQVVLNSQHVISLDMSKWTSARNNPDGSAIPKWLNRPLAQFTPKGHVGLQGKHAGAPIWFRNLRIKALDGTTTSP